MWLLWIQTLVLPLNPYNTSLFVAEDSPRIPSPGQAPSPTALRLKSASRRLYCLTRGSKPRSSISRSTARQNPLRQSHSTNSTTIHRPPKGAPSPPAAVRRRPLSAGQITTENRDPNCVAAFTPSLFSNVPPTVNFVLPHEKGN